MSLQEEGIECIQKRHNSSRRVRRYSQCREAMFDAKIKMRGLLFIARWNRAQCTGGILFAKIQRVVWLLNDDLGFGGYKKIKMLLVFEGKFNKIDMVEEPFEDLKQDKENL